MGAFQSYVSSLSPQPVLWFKFDEAPNDNTIINSGTSANHFAGQGAWKKTTGGIDGGHWEYTPTTGVAISDNTSIIPAYLNYTFSFWIRRNLPGVGTYSGQGPIAWNGGASQYQAVSGSTISIESDGKLHWYSRHGGVAHTELVSGDLRTDQWILITYTRNGSLVKLYQNGVLISSTNDAGTASSAGITGTWTFNHSGFGGTRLDEITLFTYTFTDAQVASLYSAGVPSININRSELPMTATALFVDPLVATTRSINVLETPAIATNGHFPEPVISTSIGVSFGTEPATASAQISYLSVSGSVNNQDHTFWLATCMMTEPTISFTFNDNTETQTSFLASALMVNPSSVIASINISNTADAMTASADKGTHNIVVGVSISYPAFEATASALFVEPTQFGPTDRIVLVVPMLALNAVLQGDVYVTPNQFNYIKRNNPLLYIRDYSGGNATLLNEGSLNFGTVDKGIITSSSWLITQQPSGTPLSFVGNGTSPSLKQPYSTSQGRFRYTNATFFAPTLSQMYADKAFTHEFWYKPVNSTSGSGSLNSTIRYDDKAFTYTFSHTPTSVSFATLLMGVNFGVSASTSILSSQNWHHIVILAEPVSSTQMKIGYYINGALINSSTQTFTSTQSAIQSDMLSGTQRLDFELNVGSDSLYGSYDELAIYPNTLSNSELVTHYNFINTLSPNRTIVAEDMTAEAQALNETIFVVANRVIPDTPITATSLFVNPTIIAQQSNNFITTPAITNALMVNPSFFGTPDYRQDAVPMIASAEKGNNSFALDGTYFSYVQAQIAPFRYVSFDSENPYIDHGSDNDYSVIPTVIGGLVTSAAIGINNKSVKTTGLNYATDGVILKESEWNDTWGTGQSTYHSSFWMKRAGNDQSSNGIRILWNLNGYKDNQHVILYQINNKLHMQFNNGSGTFIDQATIADVNLFDYERHHIVIVFDHTNNNNNVVKLYVDSILVMTVNLGSYTGTTTNYATSQPANDENYNQPRLGVGCLITPFASTALSAVPQITKLYIDEIHWAQTGLNQTQVTNLYNIMPQKDVVEFFADFFIGSNSVFVMPNIATGNTRIATALTASANIVQPQILTVYNNIISATPITANALMVTPGVIADNITNINYVSDIMLASAFITNAVVTITIPGQTMTANVEFAMSTNPYLDDYRLLILDQTLFQTFTVGSFGGSYAIGDID